MYYFFLLFLFLFFFAFAFLDAYCLHLETIYILLIYLWILHWPKGGKSWNKTSTKFSQACELNFGMKTDILRFLKAKNRHDVTLSRYSIIYCSGSTL